MNDDLGPTQTVFCPLASAVTKHADRVDHPELRDSATYTTSVAVGGFNFTVMKDSRPLSGSTSITQSWAFENDEMRLSALCTPRWGLEHVEHGPDHFAIPGGPGTPGTGSGVHHP